MVVTVSAARPERSSSARRSKRALNDYAAEVGERIVQARKQLETGALTQEELAELAGVSQRSMQAYETGEVIPYRKMREIADVLGVSTSWLLHGEEEHVDGEIEELNRKIDDLTKLVRSLSRKIQS